MNSEKICVFYESPFRVLKSLESIVGIDETRRVIIGRELTKFFEEVRDDTAGKMLEHFTKKEPRGEFVIIVVPPEVR